MIKVYFLKIVIW